MDREPQHLMWDEIAGIPKYFRHLRHLWRLFETIERSFDREMVEDHSMLF